NNGAMKMRTSKGEPISRATRTTAQELERQRRDAERDLAARKTHKPLTTTHEEGGSFSVLNPPPTKGGTAVSAAAGAAAVAVPDTRTPVQTYLDEIAPASIVGRMVKFDTKGGRFFTPDDDEEISADEDFVVLGCEDHAIGAADRTDDLQRAAKKALTSYWRHQV